MEKLVAKIMIYLLALSIAIPSSRGFDKSPESVESWFQTLPNLKQKVSRLHFFWQDKVSGKNPTSLPVAESSITSTSPTMFGLIRMFDDLLTEGPDPSSKLIGRAQGTYGKSSFEEVSMLVTLNFLFTEGEYNGSTLSLFGRDPILDDYREMSIIGGSGVFRLARGIATIKSTMLNLTAQDAILEFNIMVLHYVQE